MAATTLETARSRTSVFASLPLLAGIDEQSVTAIAAELEWFALGGGSVLFAEGDPADSLYILTSGLLGAFRAGPNGEPRLLGRIRPGETAGELALLSGRPRTATVCCLRDSELLRLPKRAFNELAVHHPQAMLKLAQLIVSRLETPELEPSARAASSTFAVLAGDSHLEAERFAHALTQALGGLGKAELFTRDTIAEPSSQWFNEVEAQCDFAVYLADRDASAWSAQCRRQADVLLVAAPDGAAPTGWPGLDDVRRFAQRVELVLLSNRRVRRHSYRAWKTLLPSIAMHHHVSSGADVARIARLLTGRAVGIVLSGGGARGFAHIGVVEGLREAGIDIDLAGGTSIGSIIAAGVAGGFDHKRLVEGHRRTFVATNPLSDYTLPLVSLVSGRKVTRLLRQEFGGIHIEDLPLPYYCVTANLTSAVANVHREGPLWRWLRASVAIPGVLPPVLDNGEAHVDGSVVNHLPVDIMRDLDRGPVISVDVGVHRQLASWSDVERLPLWQRLKLMRAGRAPNILQILLRAGTMTSAAATIANRDLSNVVLRPPVETFDMLDWKSFDRAIEAGYRHVVEHADAIREALANGRRGQVI
jgi:NTE family protein